MKKKKVIKIIFLIVVCLIFIVCGVNFTNTNKIAEELGLQENFSIGNQRQIENILPNKNVISIFNIGYFINDEIGLSIFSLLRLLSIVVFTYQLLNHFIKDKKIKIIGVLGIAFSSLFLMDNCNLIIDTLIFSELIIISSMKILKSEKSNLLWNIILDFSVLSIFLLLNIEMLIISILIITPFIIYGFMRENKKVNNKNFIITILISFIIGVCVLIIGKNNIVIDIHDENKNFLNMLNYFNTTFLGLENINYLSKYVGIYSLFPVPIVLMMILLSKSEKKENDFLLGLLVVCTYLIIGICMNSASMISKILLIGFLSSTNMIILIHLFNFIALLYMLDKCEMNISPSTAVTLVFISVILTVFANRPEEISSTIYLIISAGIFVLLSYMMCEKDDVRYKKVITNFLIVYFVIVGITQINITFGADILKNNELSNYIKNIENLEESKWIVLGMNYGVPEYLENLKLNVININKNKIDKENFSNMTEYEKDVLMQFYNEAKFEISGENILSLDEENNLKIEITEEYLKELGINYILTNSKLEGEKELYSNEKVFIYKF